MLSERRINMIDESIKRDLRKACGFTEPEPEPLPLPPSPIEEAIYKANAIWDWMLAQNGTIPNVLDKD